MLGADVGPPTLAGRATKGLQVAKEYGSAQIIFGTGMDENEKVRDAQGDEVVRALGDALQGIAYSIEKVSKNTAHEVERAIQAGVTLGAKRVILVSNTGHIQRVVGEIMAIEHAMRTRGEVLPIIIPVWTDESPVGVVVVEPPHRKEMPPLYKVVGPMFGILNSKYGKTFFKALERLVERYRQKIK